MNRSGAWKKAAAVAVAAAAMVCTTLTAYAATGTATSSVMVRQKASTSSTALSTVKKGETVTVLSVDGDWAKVKDGSRPGYVAARYLDISGKTSSSASSSSSSSSSTLRKGDEGDAVKEMQKKLIQLGYLDTDATGLFGSATREAVKAFQKAQGISADGLAGSATLKALANAAGGSSSGDKSSSTASSSSMQKGDEGSNVTSLQKMLIQLGYLKTDATGYFGSATKDAVLSFQKAAGLSADGVAGPATVKALEKKSGSGSTNASTSTSSSGVLREGDEKDDVKAMQELLIEAGYLKTKATGFFGSATAAAVRSFQKDHSLSADGVVGQATMTLLKKASTIVNDDSNKDNSSVMIPEEVDDGNDGAPATDIGKVEDTQVRGDIVLEDWWSGKIDSIIKRSQTFTVTDVITGKSFRCARYGGQNHLDAEPYTAEDAAIMYEIFDYKWTWSARAIWLTFDGVTYAAAMNGMPHGGQRINSNNFSGQFCIHFLNSRTHGGNRVNEDMQARIQEAFHAG